MTPQDVKRKLAAILSADVKGYSRLMGENEKGTVRTLNAYKEVMAGLIQNNHGRVVDAPGIISWMSFAMGYTLRVRSLGKSVSRG